MAVMIGLVEEERLKLKHVCALLCFIVEDEPLLSWSCRLLARQRRSVTEREKVIGKEKDRQRIKDPINNGRAETVSRSWVWIKERLQRKKRGDGGESHRAKKKSRKSRWSFSSKKPKKKERMA